MKSFVSVEQQLCEICGEKFDTGSILVLKNLKNSLDVKTVTGYGICKICQSHIDEGYIALIECDETKTKIKDGNRVARGDEYRTGVVMWLKKDVAAQVFSFPLEDHAVYMISAEAAEKLRSTFTVTDTPSVSTPAEKGN